MAVLCAVVIVATSTTALSAASPPRALSLACDGPTLPIAYRLIPFKDSREAAVWYPTSSPQRAFAYSKDIATTLAQDGVPLTACGRFPLVVFAHGLLGCGAQSIFFTEELARHGYIVVAPDYRDATLCRLESPGRRGAFVREPSVFRPQDWNSSTYADRFVDTKDLITMMLRDPLFAPQIDANRIGIAGHSLGGYTALGVVGAWPKWRDPRIKAALLLSPYSVPFSADNTLHGVTVPLMYQGAQGDIGITPFIEGKNGAFQLSNSPKYFAVLLGGNHFTWTNAVCANAGTTQHCLDSSASARLIDDYGIAFFDFYLKGRSQPLLWGSGRGLAGYIFKQ
ncbi:MAG: alpha/beta fold hydrolase [Candidatus Eremiobacteraeota bacterium]|nr:alpha/beta fold hydrolase [Candidatus Eremiobacteraeota bacterium]